MTVPKGFRAKPTHCSGPDSTVVFSFFPVFYFSAWPGKDSPSSHIFTCLGASHFKSVCHAPLNRSRKLTPFSEHSPWVSRFSENDSSWSALEKTLREKEHYKSRRIQDQGPGMEPVSFLRYDFSWFSFLLVVWLFWRLLGCLHSFLLLSIQQRAPTMHQTLLRKASPGVKWKPRQCHHGNMPFQVKSACARPPDPRKTRDECVYWAFPLTAHPITKYLLPSQAATVHSTSTICFVVLFLKIA